MVRKEKDVRNPWSHFENSYFFMEWWRWMNLRCWLWIFKVFFLYWAMWSDNQKPSIKEKKHRKDFEEMICVTCSDDTTLRIWDRRCWEPRVISPCYFPKVVAGKWFHKVNKQRDISNFPSFSIHCHESGGPMGAMDQFLKDLMGRTCLAVLEGHASRVTCLRQ